MLYLSRQFLIPTPGRSSNIIVHPLLLQVVSMFPQLHPHHAPSCMAATDQSISKLRQQPVSSHRGKGHAAAFPFQLSEFLVGGCHGTFVRQSIKWSIVRADSIIVHSTTDYRESIRSERQENCFHIDWNFYTTERGHFAISKQQSNQKR